MDIAFIYQTPPPAPTFKLHLIELECETRTDFDHQAIVNNSPAAVAMTFLKRILDESMTITGNALALLPAGAIPNLPTVNVGTIKASYTAALRDVWIIGITAGNLVGAGTGAALAPGGTYAAQNLAVNEYPVPVPGPIQGLRIWSIQN